MSTEPNIPPRLFVEHGKAIEEILRRAVVRAVSEHKRLGNPIAVWQDGAVVWLAPDEIMIDDEAATDESKD